MRPKTARAYLDNMLSAAKFDRLVAPRLDTRIVGGTLAYTRTSIDGWIERGGTAMAQTPEELARLLDHDHDTDPKG